MRSTILTGLGKCRAMLGEVEACRRAMGEQAEAWSTALETAPSWHWTRQASEAMVTGFGAAMQGSVLERLSRKHPEFAPDAVEQLRICLDSYDSTYAFGRSDELPYLASAYFHVGDLDPAVRTGFEAVNAFSGLSSKRSVSNLRLVAVAAEPFAHKSDVAELRERIRTELTQAHGFD